MAKRQTQSALPPWLKAAYDRARKMSDEGQKALWRSVDQDLVGQELFADFDRRFRAQQNKANKANETRYQSILDLLTETGEAGKAELEQGGRRAVFDIRRAGNEERAGIDQGLVGRGLFNTTVRDALHNRSVESQGRATGDVRSRVAAGKADLTRENAYQRAGVMERRTDAAPDMGLYAQLVRTLAQGMGANRSEPSFGTQLVRGFTGGLAGGVGQGLGNWLGGLF